MPLDLRPMFEAADMVFHERVAWTPEDVSDLNRVARGDTDTSMYQHPLNERVTELIKDTGSLQASWDVPAGHLSAQAYLAYFKSMRAPVSENDFQSYYWAAVSRDKLALRTIGLQVDRAVRSEKIPESPRILLIAGLSHLLMANAFKVAAPDSVRITSSFGDEIPLSAPTEYVKQRLEGETKIDVLRLASRAVYEEILSIKGLTPSHAVAERARLDTPFATPGFRD